MSKVYEATCPFCYTKTRRETAFDDLKIVNFECDKCHSRFTVSVPQDKPDIQVAWENGD